MVSKKFITKSAKETEELAANLAKRAKPGQIMALYGQLGSGKTTFVKGFARGLGIKQRILSPSFQIIREYPFSRSSIHLFTLFHIDLYRIDKLDQELKQNLKEILADKNNIIAIEWSEKIENLLPKKHWKIYFHYLSKNERRIEIKKSR